MRGLGDLISKVTHSLGLTECSECTRRKIFLNNLFGNSSDLTREVTKEEITNLNKLSKNDLLLKYRDIFNIDLKVDLNEDIRVYKKHIVSVYNIQNDLSNIDEYRNEYSKQVAQILYNFSKRYNGPKVDGCLCKSSVVNKFIDDFWLWFDELQNDIQKEEK